MSSQRSDHKTSIYTTYNGQHNVYPSGTSANAPVTNNPYHLTQSTSPAHTSSDLIDMNNPTNWGIYDDPTQPLRNPTWEPKSSSATQRSESSHLMSANYNDFPHQMMPTAMSAQMSAPYSPYRPAFDKSSSSSYNGPALRTSPQSSSGSLQRGNHVHLSQESPTPSMQAIPPATRSAHQGIPNPYVEAPTRPTHSSRSTAASNLPSQGGSSKRILTPSRTHTSAASRPPIPTEWHHLSSQPQRTEAPPVEPRERKQQTPRKSTRGSMLDGIPKDQMQRFRVVDFGPGPSSSGMKRTRSSGSDVQSNAQFSADGEDRIKSKSKVELSLEEEEQLQLKKKREAERERQQAYRDSMGDAFDELHKETYPDEEKSTFVRSDHVKQRCMRDAARQLKALRAEKAAFQEEIQQLRALTHSQAEQIGGFLTELGALLP